MPGQNKGDNAGSLGEAGDSLNHELCQQMASLVESLTTSGKPTLDQDMMKQLKKICKISDAYVEHCFHLIISQLEEEHAEIRLSAFQVINELFTRSHRFRELLVADMQEYLELTVETNVELPLPPPKPAAKILKEQALRAMQEWHNKFGKAYKKLGLGYTYLKNCKMVDFVNIQARSDAERRRAEERQRRLQLVQAQKLNQITQEMNEIIPELRECLTQCENCFQLLLPNMASNEQGESSTSTLTKSKTHQSSSRSPGSSKTKGKMQSSSRSKRNESPRTLPDKRENSKEKNLTKRKDSKQSGESNVSKSAVTNTESNKNKTDGLVATSGKSIFDIDDEPASGSCSFDKGKIDVGDEIDGTCNKEGSRIDDEKMEWRGLGDGRSSDDDGRTRDGAGEIKCEEQANACDDDDDDNSEQKEEESDEEEDNEEEDDAEMQEVMVHGRRRDVLQQHGLPSWTSISININMDADGLVIQEDTDNTAVLTTLQDQQRLLTSRYLSKINTWIEALMKMGQSDKIKHLLDLKGKIKAQQSKYNELKVKWTPSQKQSSSKKVERSNSGNSRKMGAKDNDDDDDDDDDGGFDEVPDKEGYEADIPEELRKEFGMPPRADSEGGAGTSVDWHPFKDADNDLLDPASQAGSVAAMKKRLKKIREEAQPGYHIIPEKKTKKRELTEKERKRQELLKKAPVFSFGTDLEYWKNPEDIQAPVILRPDTDARTWIGAVVDEEVVLESAKDQMKTRVMSFTGTFQPVKWKCRAPLPSGALCDRMDREKCPFHGKIIARDELGNPRDKARKGEKAEAASQGEAPAWQDAGLLRDIEGATGLDLGSSSASSSAGGGGGGKGGKGKGSGKKGKGKAKKYPGLTDIKKINNTSRNRLEKIVMNKGSLKRVAAAMSKVDQKRTLDKFGNNFNYAFKP